MGHGGCLPRQATHRTHTIVPIGEPRANSASQQGTWIRSGLWVGDLIVAVRGERVLTSEAPADALRQAKAGRRPTALFIIRRGRFTGTITPPSRTNMADLAGAPPVSFSSFITSLAASAMDHLGQLEDTRGQKPNLPLARQTIDLIAVLKEKTDGNLDGDEQRLLDTLLMDLQRRFVEVSNSS